MKVSVCICSSICDGDDRQTAEQTVNGFLRTCENSLELSYREAATEEGLGNTLTALRIFPDRMELARQGDYNCLLVLEPGVTHTCEYATPFGTMVLTTNTTAYHTTLTNDGTGDVRISYSLAAANHVTNHTLHVKTQPKS